ncbi:thioesterase family protein [Antrihabitans sp. YC2-6]|uniref:acyl-CoA thioesterase n=1 Tax=Antrihabitans sp. YC2-6 TaxID=2799498 RepID=UPI0018F655CD|nr:acyl-CoA thioesterase [Antrihabitans sp. YC2-6]MBJ8346758.1 acyl-CoA thioesterase [Antrihabitans sp. YC2-6]
MADRSAGKSFTCQVEVRWADLDLLGHVNNTKYFEYAMEARVRFYQEAVFAGERGRRAVVLRRADMDYLRPVLVDAGPLDIETVVLHIGTTSYSLRHTMRDATGEVCAVGSAVMVGWDTEDQTSRPLSDAERSALEKFSNQP